MANTQNKLTKTGECNFRDELGNLCLAESFQDETTGEVPTKGLGKLTRHLLWKEMIDQKPKNQYYAWTKIYSMLP